MRTSAPPLLPLFRSEMQVRLLALVLLQPEREWTLEELARRLVAPVSSVHRELGRLLDSGVVRCDRRRRPHAYRAATEGPAYAPLRGLLDVTVGVPRRLEAALTPLSGVEAAAVHGSWASGRVRADSDVDVFVVARGDARAVSRAVRPLEREIGREIDLSVVAPQEFRELVRSRNPFVGKILTGPRIDVVGDLAALARQSD